MGVIRGSLDPFSCRDVTPDLYNLEDLIHDAGVIEAEEDVGGIVEVERRRRRVRARNPARPVAMTGARRPKGAKKCRRYENDLLLETSAKDDDLSEVTIYDLTGDTMSAFAQLLTEAENRKIWTEFLNCTDDDHQELIAQICDGLQAETSPSPPRSPDANENNFVFASECFRRINTRFRSLLRRRHVPLGALYQLENEVIPFFVEWPREVLISERSTSFERLLMHALCQYLDLASRSFNEGNQRRTRIHNPHPEFHLPQQLLTEYLEKTFHS